VWWLIVKGEKMGLFKLFGGSDKSLQEYLEERDGAFLRQCVEAYIFSSSSYPFENNAKNGYFWGFACTSHYWSKDGYLNESSKYETIPKKYESKIDFREVLKIAADKGDGRAAFYVAMFYEFGIMGPQHVAHLAGALSEDGLTPGGLYAYADKEMAKKYHEVAAERCPEFEKAYVFLQQCLLTLTDAKGAEATHILADWMTVPGNPQIEAGLKNTAGELFVDFKLFGRYLTAILAGVRAPLALATIAIGKDLFVSNGITQGPDVLQGFTARIEAARVDLVRGQALGYVNRLAGEGNKEAQLAKNRYGITSAGKPAARPSASGSMKSSSENSERRLPKPGDLPGTIFIDGVTYNRTSGCDDYAFYDSADRTQSIQITSVFSMGYGEAETNVGHIRY